MAHPRHSPLTVVFVHGFLSSPQVWTQFLDLLRDDPGLAGLELVPFEYASPPVSLRPDRQIPRLDEIADSLWTHLTHQLADRPRLVLVTHSQGGLVTQRMLARVLADGRGRELSRLRRIVMFACPNSGSDFMLLLRRGFRGFFRNPQEKELQPFNAAVLETQRRVLNQIVHAREVGPDRCPIPIAAYGGASDAVVTPPVAQGGFADTGVVPGDHFTIIQPDSRTHDSYLTLKHHLVGMLPTGDNQPDVEPVTGTGRDGRLVDLLLAIPGMRDRAFRDQLYQRLPEPIQDQLHRYDAPRLEVVGLVHTFRHFRHLQPWVKLVEAASAQLPDHPAVDGLCAALEEQGLI